MTELHSYYALCPLIEQKSFLGVSQDKDEERVIVTLGRNVVNIYKLSDQKQIGGWTSRDHITSNVIYDTDLHSYVGVFNNKTIKLWKENSENLDKIKKYKFPLHIHKVLPEKDHPSTIIFSNGNCASLPYALDHHKTIGDSKPLLKDTDVIVDAQRFNTNNVPYICYIVKNNKNVYAIITCRLREEFGDLERTVIVKEKLTRDENVHVVGKLIDIAQVPSVFILWSDCKMRVYDLLKKTWRNFSTFIPLISTFPSVSMASMGDDHLVFFGNNKEQDGAMIVIYNTFLDVEFCKYPMKMYPEDAKLYCYNSYIILETTNHIGMLFYTLDHVKSLEKKIPEVVSPINEYTIYDWTTDETTSNSPTCTEVKKALELQQEKAKCPEDILQLLEINDYSSVLQVIKEFSDIKAPVMVRLIKYAIKLVNPDEIDVTDHEGFLNLCSCNRFNFSKEKIRKEKFEFLDYILQITFTSVPHVINGLTFDEVLFLLNYIAYMLDINEEISAINEAKLLDYCSSLIDGFFQQYLANKSDKVLYVLDRVHDVVLRLLQIFNIANDLKPLINKLFDSNADEESEDTLSYSIKLMEI